VVRHSGLLTLLTSPGGMSSKDDNIDSTAWRYAAVESLWLTAEVGVGWK
jgi:hypothetical protein